MDKILKILLSAILVNTIFMVTVFASPMSDGLQRQQNKLAQDKSTLKALQNTKVDLEVSVENLDNQIEAEISKITENKNLISEKQAVIKNTEVQIQKIDTDIVKGQELYNNRIRTMYIKGKESYILILLSSGGVSDFIGKMDTILKIIEIDKKIIKDLNDKKHESIYKKQVLSNEKEKLIALNSINEVNLTQLNEYIVSEKNMIAEIKSKEFKLVSNVNSSEIAINKTLKQIAEIRKTAPNIIVSRGAASISANNLIAYATNFIGTPYLWGGTSPSGFDCSGFTQYVYAHFGVNLGRTTYDQINDGISVDKGDLEAGDLVFFGTNGPTHMGMYVGNGTYIHAPRTGDVIKIASISRSDFITARRVK